MHKPTGKKANRLIEEKSPYLLQHAYNPVNWFPWGEEAFKKAKEEDKPVFLSIGYSTCHWCHVMERESFEDEEVAELLNRYFVAIKVDREERPDLDQVYMAACQALTGQGGWPLTVMMTADKKPFFAGTYFPKYSRYGLHGLIDLINKLQEIWEKDRSKVDKAAEELTQLLNRQAGAGFSGDIQTEPALPPASILDSACQQFESIYDHKHGGFGGAPKFPTPHQLTFLLRCWRRTGNSQALTMVLHTLKAMYRGGIFDQLGYGMHRYSVDHEWLIPHFEKMLYDQATTATAALEAYQASKDPEMAEFAAKILDYVLEEMTSPEGAFYSADDADSEGKEGTFYVWRPEEIVEVLGPRNGRLVADYFGVTEKGNFEKGKSVLHRPHDDQNFAAARGIALPELKELLERSRRLLLDSRKNRPRPFRDDKILTAWNGLIIAALARGAAVLEKSHYAQAAACAADFIMTEMVSEKGMLLRRYRDGEAAIEAFLEDYSFLVSGLLELYRSTFNSSYLKQAYELTLSMDRLYNRGDGTMRFSVASESDGALPVIAEAYDGAVPSGVSVAVMNMLKLGRIIRDEALEDKAKIILKALGGKLEQYPTGHTYLLSALEYALAPPEELVIAGLASGGETKKMVSLARTSFNPDLNILFRPRSRDDDPDTIFSLCPFLKANTAPPEGAAAYYCRDMRCLSPVYSAVELKDLLV